MSASTPIVFVHGLIGTLQVPDLSIHFEPTKTLAPDLLGYGDLKNVPAHEVSLPAQVAHLDRVLRQNFGDEPVHLVGHSVGGAIAALFAHAHPERVVDLVSVEGNFTLKDAFWSASVAGMSQEQAEAMLEGFRTDPAAWLARAGVSAEPLLAEVASRYLAQQPASTVRAMARSVVEETGSPGYLPKLRDVFSRHRVHLLAGERSRPGWDVQDWALRQANSITVIPGTGHMIMLEQPQAFASMVKKALQG
ncbi:alpha/beta fold hydrolase [Pseudoxanthomonas sp. UTMC 1351]|uniref:alpha/beta fold hydrolase n=1 Tax=Pseudoxanthomonas sp. UTMC 1351 TaxID=2695853 RepID=UPI0034CE5C5B